MTPEQVQLTCLSGSLQLTAIMIDGQVSALPLERRLQAGESLSVRR